MVIVTSVNIPHLVTRLKGYASSFVFQRRGEARGVGRVYHQFSVNHLLWPRTILLRVEDIKLSLTGSRPVITYHLLQHLVNWGLPGHTGLILLNADSRSCLSGIKDQHTSSYFRRRILLKSYSKFTFVAPLTTPFHPWTPARMGPISEKTRLEEYREVKGRLDQKWPIDEANTSGYTVEDWKTNNDTAKCYDPKSLMMSFGTVTIREEEGRCEILVFYNLKHESFQLPKGRRNLHESAADAAMRETQEETGVVVQPL